MASGDEIFDTQVVRCSVTTCQSSHTIPGYVQRQHALVKLPDGSEARVILDEGHECYVYPHVEASPGASEYPH